MMIKRAYDTQSKEARRRDILDAAERLFMGASDELPNVARVAEAAGLAKGTVYLYFGSKEEIFLTLLSDGWARVFDAFGQSFKQESGLDAVNAFIARFVALLEERPSLMRLDALGLSMESAAAVDAKLAFKAALDAQLTVAGELLEHVMDLSAGRGVQILIRTHAMTRGLWQSFGPEVGIAGSPTGRAASAFSSELREALAEYWRGALLRSG